MKKRKFWIILFAVFFIVSALNLFIPRTTEHMASYERTARWIDVLFGQADEIGEKLFISEGIRGITRIPFVEPRIRAVFYVSLLLLILSIVTGHLLKKNEKYNNDNKFMIFTINAIVSLILLLCLTGNATDYTSLKSGYGTIAFILFLVCEVAMLFNFDFVDEIEDEKEDNQIVYNKVTQITSDLDLQKERLKNEAVIEKLQNKFSENPSKNKNYYNLTVVELKQLAKERNIKGISNMKKNDLIEALIEYDNENE